MDQEVDQVVGQVEEGVYNILPVDDPSTYHAGMSFPEVRGALFSLYRGLYFFPESEGS